MELRQLRYTEAVARHRHFTRAAEELHVAQSALSEQIRRLEQELGTKLFERTSRRVVCTEAGEAVALRARRILAEVDGVRTDVDDVRGLLRGRVSIGALLPAGGVDVPALLAGFSQAYPGIDIDLREGTAGEFLRLLERDEVDAAFVMLAGPLPTGLVADHLGDEELVAAFPPDAEPGAQRITAASLATLTVITPRAGSATKRALDDFFGRADQRLHVCLESGDAFLLRCLVASGFGVAVLPHSLTERYGPPVQTRPLSPPVRVPVALVHREQRRPSRAAQAFREFVLRHAS